MFYSSILQRRTRTNMEASVKESYPNDTDLISVIVGNLLGNVYGEFRGNNVIFCFKQSNIHADYLL